VELGLSRGLVAIVGDNGVGKTNLLEAIHLATQGFSPRTRSDAQLIRFGESAAAISLVVNDAGTAHRVGLRITDSGKSATLDGAGVESIESLRRRFPALVFTPDRLSVIKGGPAIRRAYFDRALGRLYPARSELPSDYAAAIAQRNAALRRVEAGVAPRDILVPWTARAAELGSALVDARCTLIDALTWGFRTRLAELGLEGGALSYIGDPPTVAALERRLDADIAAGTTGLGPHRDDVRVSADGHDLRSFGSQGQQRLALLALLLAEATLAPSSPLLLLDDVLSELDGRRRGILAAHVATLDQTLITTTHHSALPTEPDQLVEVSPGQAH
jgi:DNA replication and repair protein RecF